MLHVEEDKQEEQQQEKSSSKIEKNSTMMPVSDKANEETDEEIGDSSLFLDTDRFCDEATRAASIVEGDVFTSIDEMLYSLHGRWNDCWSL